MPGCNAAVEESGQLYQLGDWDIHLIRWRNMKRHCLCEEHSTEAAPDCIHAWDFKAHNILVSDDNHLSGFIDWESAGCCPEYWEFYRGHAIWEEELVVSCCSVDGVGQYLKELECDIALNLLTIDS